MKPRLRMRYGVWSCVSWRRVEWGLCATVGHGYTPREAYDDWTLEVNRE